MAVPIGFHGFCVLLGHFFILVLLLIDEAVRSASATWAVLRQHSTKNLSALLFCITSCDFKNRLCGFLLLAASRWDFTPPDVSEKTDTGHGETATQRIRAGLEMVCPAIRPMFQRLMCQRSLPSSWIWTEKVGKRPRTSSKVIFLELAGPISEMSMVTVH